MGHQRINRFTGAAPIGMSIAAYLLVLVFVAAHWTGDGRDEGTGAHLFQLLVAGQVPIVLIYLASADWRRFLTILRTLLFQALALAIAFGAVFLAKL